MNDIVSLDAARRARQQRPSAGSRADHPSAAAGAERRRSAVEEWAPTPGGGAVDAARASMPEGAGEAAETGGPPELGSSGRVAPDRASAKRTARSSGARAASARAQSAWSEADGDDDDEPGLSDEERLSRVSDTVVRALGRRQLSAGETRELLLAQGAEDHEADALVVRYEELGYLDDAALAETLVEKLSDRNHKSRGLIARELSARKIPSELVTAALENLDDDHEIELAVEAATKRVSQLSAYDDQTVERRLNGFLTRRGFGSGIVREATRRAMSQRKTFGGPRFR